MALTRHGYLQEDIYQRIGSIPEVFQLGIKSNLKIIRDKT